MNKKVIAVILAVVALGILGYWASTGRRMFTQTEVAVDSVRNDPIFGTSDTVRTWKKDFQPGLLEEWYLGPAAGVLLVGAIVMLWSASRQKRATT
jgi:hypothetical protein